MSHAIRHRDDSGNAGTPALELMLRHSRLDYQENISPALRRCRYFIGPAERRRLKAIRAAGRRGPK
jgi:hypothetical protein